MKKHMIFILLQVTIPIVSKTNLSVLLYNTFHPQNEENLESIVEETED